MTVVRTVRGSGLFESVEINPPPQRDEIQRLSARTGNRQPFMARGTSAPLPHRRGRYLETDIEASCSAGYPVDYRLDTRLTLTALQTCCVLPHFLVNTR